MPLICLLRLCASFYGLHHGILNSVEFLRDSKLRKLSIVYFTITQSDSDLNY